MTLKDILQKAKLNEDGSIDQSILTELESFVTELVEARVHDKAAQLIAEATKPVIDEAREELIGEYEQKFEEYKDNISSSFSNFVDTILDEELEIPVEIQEWAQKGQRYSDLIEEIRTRVAVDEGLVEVEANELIGEAKDEIISLQDQLNRTISENFTIKRDAEAMATALYLRTKCDGLTESQKSRIMPLLEDERDASVIDKKFDFIVENVISGMANLGTFNSEDTPPLGAVQTDIQNFLEKECTCPNCKKVVTSSDNVTCSMLKCSDCENTYLVDKTPGMQNESKSKTYGVNKSASNIAARLYAQYM